MLGLEHITSLLGGGVLGLIGHGVTKGIDIWQHREDLKNSQMIEQLSDHAKELIASYENQDSVDVAQIKPGPKISAFLGFVEGIKILYHPMFALLTFFSVGMLFFVDIPDDKSFIAHAMVGWCSMLMTWLSASVGSK